MDSCLFREYLENGFDKALADHQIPRPVLLLIDGARCHLSIEASEFCDQNGIYLYTLFPNATHLLQPLDLSLMGSLKTNYRSEMKKWYIKNIGASFDKYEFIEVFRSTYDLSATLTNAQTGFESSGISPWNPEKVRTKKLFPGSLYKPKEPLLEVAADKSLVEDPAPTPPTPGTAPTPLTPRTAPTPPTPPAEAIPSTSNDEQVAMKSLRPGDTPAMFVNEPMFVKIGGKKFKLVEEVEEPAEGKEDKIARILDVPKLKTKLGGARVSGLPQCVSSQKFRDVINAAEAKKKEKHDEIEKRKAERKAKAKAKKKEKEEVKRQKAAKRAADKAAKASAKKRGRRGKKKVVKESLSEEEMEIKFQDSSEYESEDDYYDT